MCLAIYTLRNVKDITKPLQALTYCDHRAIKALLGQEAEPENPVYVDQGVRFENYYCHSHTLQAPLDGLFALKMYKHTKPGERNFPGKTIYFH